MKSKIINLDEQRIKNHLMHVKMSADMRKEIQEISDALEMTECGVVRLLLGNAIVRLKADAQKVGGYNKLVYTTQDS